MEELADVWFSIHVKGAQMGPVVIIQTQGSNNRERVNRFEKRFMYKLPL